MLLEPASELLDHDIGNKQLSKLIPQATARSAHSSVYQAMSALSPDSA